MINCLKILIVLVFFQGCGQSGSTNKVIMNEPPKMTTVKIPSFSVIPFDTLINQSISGFFKEHSPTELTKADLELIQGLISRCTNDYNVQKEREFEEDQKKFPTRMFDKNKYLIELSRYNKQYIPVVNSKGEKEVWINCFCVYDSISWKTRVLFVQDGGSCFFNFKVNLKTGRCYDFNVNGEA